MAHSLLISRNAKEQLPRQQREVQKMPRKTAEENNGPWRPLGAGCRRWRYVFRPPGQVAISAAAPERPEKVPVLEERPAATRTCKARHSDASPGYRGHPGERDKEKRHVLEKQVVQQISDQIHSGNATEEQEPKSCRPAIQITPCYLERKMGEHNVCSCYLLTIPSISFSREGGFARLPARTSSLLANSAVLLGFSFRDTRRAYISFSLVGNGQGAVQITVSSSDDQKTPSVH